jgi:hypothetical protein
MRAARVQPPPALPRRYKLMGSKFDSTCWRAVEPVGKFLAVTLAALTAFLAVAVPVILLLEVVR